MPINNTQIGYAILESNDVMSDAVIVTENSRRVVAEGKLQTAEEENRNGRCYLYSDLLREIACPRSMELFNTGNFRGECGHPINDDSLIRQQTIDPKNTIVKFLKMWMDGNDVKSRFRGTNNELGDSFDLDLRDGDKPSFSLRALGTLNNIKGRNVVCNLKMITYDMVIYPSHSGAYTEKIVTESAKNAINSSYMKRSIEIADKLYRESMLSQNKKFTSITEAVENRNGILIPITNDSIISYIKTESANIRSIIEQIDIFYESVKLVNGGQNVQLTTKAGDVFVVNLESYIQDEIQTYCATKLN